MNDKLDFINTLLDSELEENKVLGSFLLLHVDNFEREFVKEKIDKVFSDYILGNNYNDDVLKNFIEIYSKINKDNSVKNRVKKI